MARIFRVWNAGFQRGFVIRGVVPWTGKSSCGSSWFPGIYLDQEWIQTVISVGDTDW